MMKKLSDTDYPFQDGDVIHVFDNSLLGMIRKFITRKSFTRTGIHMNINGISMIVTNRRRRIVFIDLRKFIDRNPNFITNHLAIKNGNMRTFLHEFGKKKRISVLVAEVMEIYNPESLTSDKLYLTLN